LSRAVRPTTNYLPVASLAALLVLSGQIPPFLPGPFVGNFPNLVGVIRNWPLAPGGRIFATPNDHLVLTYYSGRPVQSIAPVRREWLDRFAGDLLIVEGARYRFPTLTEVQEIARRQGRVMNEIEANARAMDAAQLAAGLELQASGGVVVPAPRMPDELDRALIGLVHDVTRVDVGDFVRGTLIGRGRSPADYLDLRNDFFYWFSNPERRTGAGLNYRGCRDRAVAYLHSTGFVLLDCRVNREGPLPLMSVAPSAVP
jgi:hypothetical protein